MGYTPLEGLVMATRSGNVDPGLLLELMREGYSEDEIAGILQKESGLKGLSGLSGDMRTIREAAANGQNGAIRALGVFGTGCCSCLSRWPPASAVSTCYR